MLRAELATAEAELRARDAEIRARREAAALHEERQRFLAVRGQPGGSARAAPSPRGRQATRRLEDRQAELRLQRRKLEESLKRRLRRAAELEEVLRARGNALAEPKALLGHHEQNSGSREAPLSRPSSASGASGRGEQRLGSGGGGSSGLAALPRGRSGTTINGGVSFCSGAHAAESAVVWQQRVATLADELKQKSERVATLRQREQKLESDFRHQLHVQQGLVPSLRLATAELRKTLERLTDDVPAGFCRVASTTMPSVAGTVDGERNRLGRTTTPAVQAAANATALADEALLIRFPSAQWPTSPSFEQELHRGLTKIGATRLSQVSVRLSYEGTVVVELRGPRAAMDELYELPLFDLEVLGCKVGEVWSCSSADGALHRQGAASLPLSPAGSPPGAAVSIRDTSFTGRGGPGSGSSPPRMALTFEEDAGALHALAAPDAVAHTAGAQVTAQVLSPASSANSNRWPLAHSDVHLTSPQQFGGQPARTQLDGAAASVAAAVAAPLLAVCNGEGPLMPPPPALTHKPPSLPHAWQQVMDAGSSVSNLSTISLVGSGSLRAPAASSGGSATASGIVSLTVPTVSSLVPPLGLPGAGPQRMLSTPRRSGASEGVLPATPTRSVTPPAPRGLTPPPPQPTVTAGLRSGIEVSAEVVSQTAQPPHRATTTLNPAVGAVHVGGSGSFLAAPMSMQQAPAVSAAPQFAATAATARVRSVSVPATAVATTAGGALPQLQQLRVPTPPPQQLQLRAASATIGSTAPGAQQLGVHGGGSAGTLAAMGAGGSFAMASAVPGLAHAGPRIATMGVFGAAARSATPPGLVSW